MTMINGEIVWENGVFTRVDEAEIFEGAEKALATLDGN
jgi:hydroxyatrazine ethylaminohydrolase